MRKLACQTDNQSKEQTNLTVVLDLAVKASIAGNTVQANRLFDVCAAFGAEAKGKRSGSKGEQGTAIGTSYTSVTGPKNTGRTKRFEPIDIPGVNSPGQENSIPGGITFNDNARPSSDDIGFIPYVKKNLRELHGLLPLTISNATWQAKAINHHTLHGTKKSKSDDTGDDKTKYSGLPYPDKYARSYADWSMNYQGFLDALIKVCKFNVFARRMVMDDGSLLVANISIFNKTAAQASSGKARRFLELDFTDNPYAKGAEREGWDTATSKPFEVKETNTGRRGTGGQNNQQTSQPPSKPPASRPDNGKAPSTSGYRGNRFNPRHNDRDRYDRDRKDDRRGNGYDRDRRDDRRGKGYNL
ncbi:hypothetical protein MJO28_004041 [Puccinia striiformis f. sp. tritici]|uniref:Uncharacterized protein n=1 Tax=Puccinia striiformis f. sp. tritici TaxID=168172 RepID=A0ACC0ENG3_9BASI|nr:hypothetical protein MJO28_004041 [Puccinia striiformis f. sp. tritici]